MPPPSENASTNLLPSAEAETETAEGHPRGMLLRAQVWAAAVFREMNRTSQADTDTNNQTCSRRRIGPVITESPFSLWNFVN